MDIVDAILKTFVVHGNGAYFGENVSETEHALQCAFLARQSGADDALVAAALLHDIGHLLHGLPEDIASRGIDGQHEDAGAKWLKDYFPASVVDPVRLHVAAKRYLCTTMPEYLNGLSPASKQSLKLQGGTMSTSELESFRNEPHAKAAVALRRWDDGAKVPDLNVPNAETYRGLLNSLLIGNRE